MENAVYEEDFKGLKIKIFHDEDCESPRSWCDHLGTMSCWHRNYDLGDNDHGGVEKEELIELVKRPDVVSLPLYLLDHSGLWMSCGRYSCDPGGWDTSHVGYIWITHEKIKKEYSKKRLSRGFLEKIRGYLENEVKEYNDYLSGNVYGFQVGDENEKDLESCWGFIGDYDGKESGVLVAARESAEWVLKSRAEQAEKEQAAMEDLSGLVSEMLGAPV